MEGPFYGRFRCLSCDGPVIARVVIERGVATESTNSCSIPTLASNLKWLVELKLGSLAGPVCMELCMKSVSQAQGRH